MELTLQPEEAALVKRVLSNYLPELRGEIGKTDSYALRQDLKRDEEMLRMIIARLEQARVTSA